MEAQLLELMAEHRERGLQGGSQLVVSLRGASVVDLAEGEAAPGVAMTGAHILRWYEAGMPQLAVVVGHLLERGKLQLDDLVARYVPGWENGKQGCSIRHLLTHMGGFPGAELGDRDVDHDAAVSFIAGYRAESPPGMRAAFHPTSGWRILAEVVQRSSRSSLSRLVHRHVWKPAGMPGAALGLTPGAQRRLGHLLAPVQWRGWDTPAMVDGTSGRVPFRLDLIHNLDWHMAKVDPAIGWFGTARDLDSFYRALNAPEHPLFSSPTTGPLLTSTHRMGLRDHSTGGATVPYGLGFQTAAAFGGTNGYRAHGHTGRTGRALHDPVEGLTFVYLTNGLCRPEDNERRCAEMYERVQTLLLPKPSGAWISQGLRNVVPPVGA